MTSKLSITVSLTAAPNTARIAVSGPLTVENAPAVIAVARRVSGLDGGFDTLIDISGLSCPETEALQALKASGFKISAAQGRESPGPGRSATAVPA